MQPLIMNDKNEKREKNRKICRYLPVDFVVEDRLQRGVIIDISQSGARIENTMPLSPGQITTMTFMENNDKGPIKTTCRVVRSCDNGFAVNFDVLTPYQAEAIGYFVDTE